MTLTDILTTCEVDIFSVKVSGIKAVDGIKLWSFNLIGQSVAMLLVVCQLSHDGYEDPMLLVHFDPSIVTVKQSFIVCQIVGCSVILPYLVLLSRLYGAGNC